MEQQQFAKALLEIYQQQVELFTSQIEVLKKYAGTTENSSSSKGGKAQNSKKGAVNVKSEATPTIPEANDKKKRKKGENTQHHPKSLSGYQIFIRDEYKVFKSNHPDMNPNEVMSNISKHWKGLDPDQKSTYVQKAEQLKGGHAVEVDEAPAPAPAPVAAAPKTPKSVSTPIASRAEPIEDTHDDGHDDGDDADRKKKKKKKHHHEDEGVTEESGKKKVRDSFVNIIIKV